MAKRKSSKASQNELRIREFLQAARVIGLIGVPVAIVEGIRRFVDGNAVDTVFALRFGRLNERETLRDKGNKILPVIVFDFLDGAHKLPDSAQHSPGIADNIGVVLPECESLGAMTIHGGEFPLAAMAGGGAFIAIQPAPDDVLEKSNPVAAMPDAKPSRGGKREGSGRKSIPGLRQRCIRATDSEYVFLRAALKSFREGSVILDRHGRVALVSGNWTANNTGV